MPLKDKEEYNAYMRAYNKRKTLERQAKREEKSETNKGKTNEKKPEKKIIQHKPIKIKHLFSIDEIKGIKDILIRALRNRTVHKEEDELVLKFLTNFGSDN